QGGLAGSAASYECDGRAWLDGQVDVLQYRFGRVGVTERQVLDADRNVRRQLRCGARHVAHPGAFLEKARDAVQGGAGPLGYVDDRADLSHRIDEHGQIGGKRDQVVELRVASYDPHRSQSEGHEKGDASEEV